MMFSGVARRSNAKSGSHRQVLAVLIAAVVGLAVGGAAGVLITEPHANVAAQPQRQSASREFDIDDFLEAQLITEARSWAAEVTAARIVAAAHRRQDVALELRLINEARLLAGVVPLGATSPPAQRLTTDDVLESRLLTEARLLTGTPAGVPEVP